MQQAEIFDLKQKLSDGLGLLGARFESRHSPDCESRMVEAVTFNYWGVIGAASKVSGISLNGVII